MEPAEETYETVERKVVTDPNAPIRDRFPMLGSVLDESGLPYPDANENHVCSDHVAYVLEAMLRGHAQFEMVLELLEQRVQKLEGADASLAGHIANVSARLGRLEPRQ